MRIRSIFAIATVLAFGATIGVPSATAQSPTVKTKVPFEFYAAGKLFPAGTYTLSRLNPLTLRLNDARGRSVFIPAGREFAKLEDQNWVAFHQYGDVRFFAGAHWYGSGVSLKVAPSQAELEIAEKGGKKRPITIATK